MSDKAAEAVEVMKPCPFCGTTAGLYLASRSLGDGKPYAIDCVGCGIEFTPRDGMDVISAWNRRTPTEGETE